MVKIRVLRVLCAWSDYINDWKMGFHSQLPGVGMDLGVFGVPGTSKTSSSNDLAKPLGLTTNGSDWFLFGRSSSTLFVFSVAALETEAWRELGKLVSSIPWFNSSASKFETSKRLISRMCGGGRVMIFSLLMAQSQEQKIVKKKLLNSLEFVSSVFCTN